MLQDPQIAATDRTERMFDRAPEALLVVRDGVVERMNDRASELVGHDLTGSAIRDAVPDWREGLEQEVPFDATVVHAGREDLPVEVRVRTCPDGAAIVSLRDARELLAGREAEAALAEAEERYRSLVEQIPAVVYADEGMTTHYVSPQIQQILGVTPDAYRADPGMWLRMVHPDDRAWVEAQSDAFLAGDGGDLDDYRMIRPDGRVVWVRDRAYAHRDPEGKVQWEHGILFDVTELKDAEARIAHMAFHDGLTGLANRALFEETLGLALERARRASRMVGVLFIDLDNFKVVNDTLGHHAGDRLLAELAERLTACTRGEDLVARQGGDEFLMVLGDLSERSHRRAVDAVVVRIRAALGEPFDLLGTEFQAHASIGVSLFPRDGEDVETLLRNADIAMYRAKALEPGGHVYFVAEP
jgi:diguanylate cyclase (GGDEF)-like protein/PAS domain S-box-containing protein